jgi:aconitate hydratase
VQYVDHNLLQTDSKNAEDHDFLRSACQRFGLWYSKPGNGVSHPTHMQRFGRPGATMAGSDSHTPAAGSLGMLAIGLGGIEVAMAIAGEPIYLRMPEILRSPWSFAGRNARTGRSRTTRRRATSLPS